MYKQFLILFFFCGVQLQSFSQNFAITAAKTLEPKDSSSLNKKYDQIKFTIDKSFRGNLIEVYRTDKRTIATLKNGKLDDQIPKSSDGSGSYVLTILLGGKIKECDECEADVPKDFTLKVGDKFYGPFHLSSTQPIHILSDNKKNEYHPGYIFYDALYLRDSINNKNIVKAILNSYGIKDSLDLRNNIFLKDYIPEDVFKRDTSISGFSPSLSPANLISSAGGLNVTNFADGLAKFLVKRFKEELSITFFEKFKDEVSRSEELRTLFPEAYKVLIAIDKDIYRFNAYLNTLREAFIKDLINLYTDFKKLISLPKYKVYFDQHIEIKTIIVNALYLIDQYASGVHPGDVLAKYNLEDLNFKDPALQKNIRSSIELIQAFSTSFKSISTEHYWVTADSVKELLGKEVSRNIYFGLMYQKYGNIAFDPSNGNTLRFDTLLARAKRVANDLNEYKDFTETFIAHAQEINEYLSELKSKKKEDIDYNDYYKLYNASLDLLEHSFTFVDLPHVNLKPETEDEIRFQSNRWLFVARSTAELYIDIRTKNYSSAILNASGIIDTILGEKKLPATILKYGNFAAEIAQAQNSDDVQKAIESIALPVGSSRIKRESLRNISLNAYVGGFAGGEYMPTLKEKQNSFVFGLTAPVGVALSFGGMGKGPEGKKGGKSISIFVSAIDVGALATFRINDDSSKVASEIKLRDIVSPGVMIYYGFGKCPISLGAGIQLGPQLREVTAKDINVEKNYYLRYGISLAVDIPILNFYTKSR